MSEKRQPICNFAFIDLETTGLPKLENYTTKITELSISIVQSEHLSSGEFPRVVNKITLCFDPCKPISPKAAEMSGLSNDSLENQPTFSSNNVEIIKNFLNLHKQPICLVAHYGKGFDYPILRNEINGVRGTFLEDILCIDSLECFKDLHQNSSSTTDEGVNIRGGNGPASEKVERISFQLYKVYKRLFSKEPENSHQAEGDVKCLIHCASKYGDDFIRWANDNAIFFKDIPSLRPDTK